MRISDWSSDVCSSDLGWRRPWGSPASAKGWEARSQEPHHRPACKADETEQHHKRISINITRLQPDREPGPPLDERCGAIGAAAVDGTLIPALPEEAAGREGRLPEQDVKELAEIPIIEPQFQQHTKLH